MNIASEFNKILEIAYACDSTVFISGSTGTGKSTLAKQIHLKSRRAARPFVVVNLASLHEGTLESELFGHERGAFTGADRKREGRLAQAEGGTVFLDEVGELSLRMQARLLEFIQSRTITALGANDEQTLDVRVIVATHRDLFSAVKKGTFREDLFHRLRVLPIELKSLSERGPDFGEVVHACLRDLTLQLRRPIYKLTEGVAEKLESYDWPGNIRELKNVLEYSILASRGPEICLQDLPPWFLIQNSGFKTANDSSSTPVLGLAEIPLSLDFQKVLAAFEKEYFQRALARNRGRVSKTAREIGLNRTTFLRRVRLYGLLNT